MKIIIKPIKLEKGYKPTILMKILLTICIICYGLSALFNSFIGIFNQQIQDIITNPNMPSYLHFYRLNLLDIITRNPYYFLIIGSVGIAITISFVILYRGFTTGFYVYLVSQILAIIIPIIFFGKKAIAIGDIMIAILLIIFFLIQIISNQTKAQKREVLPIEIISTQEEKDIEKE
ncbi:MAG: hypothetical protein WC679_13110 [Bacteroidales bacterium]|jgi:hypothetical protein